MKTPAPPALAKAEFEALSEFRYQIRRFERFSEDVVQRRGITPQQYLLLLHVKGYPGRDHATVGELAERLQARPNGVVALATRCEAHGWVVRRRGAADQRQVQIHLTADGEALLAHLADLHRTELRSLQATFPIAAINEHHA